VEPEPPPGDTCAEVYDCLAVCGPDNPQCAQVCLTKASSEATSQLNQFSQCLQANCPVNASLACAVSNCLSTFQACFPSGDEELNCGEIFDCAIACGPTGGPSCSFGCVSSAGSAASAADVGTVNDCVAAACPSGVTQACFDSAIGAGGACASEYEQCAGYACPGYIECLAGCAQNQACAQACGANTDPDVLALGFDYATCANETCAETPSFTCVADGCWPEFTGCFASGGEPLSCGESYECAQGCGGSLGCANTCYADAASVDVIAELFAAYDCATDGCEGDPACALDALENNPICAASLAQCIDPGEEPPLEGACLNDVDEAALADKEAAVAAASQCALSCLGDAPSCTTDCAQDALGLTAGCASCVGDVMGCTISNCVAQCAVDPASAACLSCIAANCGETFTECSGLESFF